MPLELLLQVGWSGKSLIPTPLQSFWVNLMTSAREKKKKKKKKKSQLARKRQRGIVSVVPFVWSIVHLSSRQQATPIRNFLSSQAHLASKSWQWSGVPPVPQSFCIAIYRLANDTARQHKAGEWNDNIQHIGGGWRKSPEQQRQSHRPGKERRIGTS